MSTLQPRQPHDAAPAAAASVSHDVALSLVLAGRCCQIICVDDVLPQHHGTAGGQRVRQCYAADEVVHFDFAGHRWALVRLPEAAPAPLPAPLLPPARDIHALLTNRELQIVQLICAGLITKQVSDRLRISEFTVRSYLKNIYSKLGVRSRGAMVYAYAQAFQRSRPVADA